MGKKSFDTQNATDKFFTQGTQTAQDTQEIQDTQKSQNKQGRPKKEVPLRGYRYSLCLDADLKQPMKELAWQSRKSLTQYVNDLIRADYEKYLAECKEKGKDPFEGWESDEV